jgi:hypothetical protein
MNQSFDALRDACAKEPLFTLFVQFGYPREFWSGKGDPGDPWGNFFLLAVTEHLGSGGRGWKSKHELAYRLLQTLRKGAGPDVRPIRPIGNPKHSVAGRVADLKKKNNLKWQPALSLLESEFFKH